MNQAIHSIFEYLKQAGVETLYQLLMLLGPLLVLSFILNVVSCQIEKGMIRLLGIKGYLATVGWLGIPIHESGHALFALLFGHKITRMELFKPDPKSGTMGFVAHSYNQKNLYHQIGNFFIGIGPVILGSLMLVLLSLLLFKVNIFKLSEFNFSFDTLSSVSSLKPAIQSLWSSTVSLGHQLFQGENSSLLKIVVFIYCLFAIGGFIKLSPPDLSSAGKGFLFIMVLIFFFNVATLWTGDFTHECSVMLSSFLSDFYFLLLLSIAVNLIFLVVLLIPLGIKQIFKS